MDGARDSATHASSRRNGAKVAPGARRSSKSLWFGAIGLPLFALAFLSFAGEVVHKVFSGHGDAMYRTVKNVAWSYNSAFVVLVGMALVLIVAGVVRLWRWFRDGRGSRYLD